ncbi:MAG: hypothetical protein KDA66_14020, partial [Planctomycetaceae bacterium]|nr:hypothetical protein [Planctomycetaceae bacterium]
MHLPILRILLLLLLTCSSGRAAVIRVPSDFPLIQTAIDSCASGDTLWLAPGTYFERLIVPDQSLTLCSDDFFTGDSSAINTTIIDAEWLGTLIQVYSQGEHVFRIESLTLQRGLGEAVPSHSNAGALQLYAMANLTLRHIVLRDNKSYTGSCVLYGDRLTQLVGRVVMEDIMLYVSRLSANQIPLHRQFWSFAQYFEINKFRHSPFDGPVVMFAVNADTVIINDVCIHDQRMYYGGLSFTSHNLGRVHEISVRNCNITDSSMLSIRASSSELNPFLEISGITIENCITTQDWDVRDQSPFLDVYSSGTVDAQRITVRNCTTNTSGIVRIIGEGWLRNLLVEDNVAGADPDGFVSNCEHDCFGRIVDTAHCSVEDAVVQNNVSNIYQFSAPNGNLRQSDGKFLALTLGGQDGPGEMMWRRIVIQNNLVNDFEDYTDLRLPRSANLGRALLLTMSPWSGNQPGVLQDVIIRNNRQPNSIPERHGNDAMLDGRMVGSTVELGAGTGGPCSLVLRNVLIEDNDDGGVAMQTVFSTLTAENVVSRNNGRLGLLFAGDTLVLKNVLVTGTDSWGAYYSYPYEWLFPTHQTALGLHLGHNTMTPRLADISNVTLYDNDTECVFWTVGMDMIGYQRLQIRNSILWDNDCDWFVSPCDDFSNFESPTFRYCLLDAPEPGVGNMSGVDPQFHPTWGAPWLSPNSPAIDAGDPSIVDQDVEDPNLLGQALWPSQGILRNDMGYTGGPGAFAIDTSWVALQRPKPRPKTLPRGFELGAPYPNPFNPSTRIPFTLDR